MKVISSLLFAVLALAACVGRSLPPDDSLQFGRNSEFDGRKLRFFLTLEDGTAVSVNTADDVIESQPGETPMPGHRAQALTFLKETDEGTSVAYALLSWDPDNPADYLAFGWWTQFPDQHPPNLSFRGSEQYSIVDGTEIDHAIPVQLPGAGTATYSGQAGGLYAYLFGSDWGEDEGGVVVDEYQGTLTLTVDFADGTVKGCIGCVGDLVTQRAHFGVFLGEEPRDTQGLARDYELHLASAIIGEDGTFERDRVTLRHPERTITLSEGSWGGLLSRRQDTDGAPRLVAGFSSVEFRESDGSEGEFVGSLLGLSDTFRQNGTSGPLPGSDR
ncbi:MAG: transferrin-binding protein-like solute binding protein [Alphaproteobacteria bacterium]|nr:transferrin-binding protein-like solute binding protein [Alphaproteobacteria bacterium]